MFSSAPKKLPEKASRHPTHAWAQAPAAAVMNPPSMGQVQAMVPEIEQAIKQIMGYGYDKSEAERLSKHPLRKEAEYWVGNHLLEPDRAYKLTGNTDTKRAVELHKQYKGRGKAEEISPERAYELAQEERLAKEEAAGKKKKHGLKKIGHTFEKTIRKGVKPIIKALPKIAGIVGGGLLGGKLSGALSGEEDEGEEGSIGGGGGYQAPQPQGIDEDESAFNPLMAMMPSALDLFEKLHGRKDTEREKKKREHDEKPDKIRQYKKGGFTGHIDEGSESGIADNIPKKIPDKSYVWDATSVSLLGDGSSKNGIKKLEKFDSHVNQSGVLRGHQHSGYKNLINAKVSRDEYVMKPETVAAIGGGSFKRGAQMNDMARMNLRRQKGLSQKILPPNAKDVAHYFRGGY